MVKKKAADENLFRISEAAQQAGVPKQTIEYYIMVGLVLPLRRAGHAGRYFDENLIKRIRLIHRLNRSGYPLREIRETYFRRKR